MFDEFEKEDDQWRPDEPKAWKITKKALGWAFAAFVILFIGFLVLRMLLSDPPSSMEKVVWNQKLFDTYTVAKNEKRELEVLKIPTSDSFSEDGFHSIYEIAYVPEAKQLQFTVRHNDRAVKYLAQDHPEVRDIEKNKGEIYVYSLTVRSAESSATVDAYGYTSDSRFGYTYRRLIFDDIDLTGVTSIKLNIACSVRPTVTLQTINVYSNSVYKTASELPDFSYDAPKKVTGGIKQKESAQ